VQYVTETHTLSERKACRVLSVNRGTCRYKLKPKDDQAVASALQQLAETQPRWGCRKMTVYLRNQGHVWNHKRIRRIYRHLGLHLQRKPKKRLAPRTAVPLEVPQRPRQVLSVDFMSDSLASGKPIRTLNILDDYNREVLWIEVDTSLPAERVVRVLEDLLLLHPAPDTIRMDNGPEFISKRLAEWARQKHIELRHIQPGKPAQNAYIERFNRTYREEVLDAYLFHNLEEVRLITIEWMESYNSVRPHQSLGGLSPRQFLSLNA
jgi:putative transposase